MTDYHKNTVLTLVFIFFANLVVHSQKDLMPNQGALVKITILYPNDEGKTFDMEYYKTKHMPMLAELFGASMVRYEIDKGIMGRTPNEPIPFLAIGYLYFNSIGEYQKAFGSNAKKILGDIPNYTNIKPTVQISEVIR